MRARDARAKSLTSGQPAFGFSGATTCRPLPPVVLTKAARPGLSSRSRTSRARRRSPPPRPRRRRGRGPSRSGPGSPAPRASPASRAARARRPAPARRGRRGRRPPGSARPRSSFGSSNGQDVAAEPLPGVLLEEALGRVPPGQRSSASGRRTMKRRHPRPDRAVVLGEALLGDARVRPRDPAGIGQARAAGAGRFAAASRFAGDLGGGLVVAQAAEAACRTSPSAVQLRNSTSATSSGATQTTPRRAAADSGSANGALVARPAAQAARRGRGRARGRSRCRPGRRARSAPSRQWPRTSEPTARRRPWRARSRRSRTPGGRGTST